jgi:hypothetical protein
VRGYNLVHCHHTFWEGRFSLKRSNKKQRKGKRFLKRLKSHGKWKHGKSNIEKVRRKKERCQIQKKPEAEIHKTCAINYA